MFDIFIYFKFPNLKSNSFMANIINYSFYAYVGRKMETNLVQFDSLHETHRFY